MNDADLAAALVALRDSLGDLATLNNIILGLRHNAARLLSPLATVLHETRDAIDHVLTLIEGRAL
jgi:hypothetical protein